jgi:ABC-2 type transport system permease protein
MSQTVAPALVAGKGSGTPRQLAALLRMEVIALRRNKAASFISVLFPLAVGFIRTSGHDAASVGESGGVTRMAGTVGLVMVLLVHHHLITVYAARRQELVLKRLRAGLPSDRTILAGAASGTVAVFLATAVILVSFGVLVLDLPVPANPLTMVLALGLGAGVLAAFSAALSTVTRTSEAAMMTSAPTMVAFFATPGLLTPYGALPPEVEAAAWYSPLGPFPEVLRTGWLGRDADGADLGLFGSVVDALPALGVLSGWLLLVSLVASSVFRWEPRHR